MTIRYVKPSESKKVEKLAKKLADELAKLYTKYDKDGEFCFDNPVYLHQKACDRLDEVYGESLGWVDLS